MPCFFRITICHCIKKALTISGVCLVLTAMLHVHRCFRHVHSAGYCKQLRRHVYLVALLLVGSPHLSEGQLVHLLLESKHVGAMALPGIHQHTAQLRTYLLDYRWRWVRLSYVQL